MSNPTAYFADGDLLRGEFIVQIGRLLDANVPVTLIYGDRDFRCNCKRNTLDPFLTGFCSM